MGVILAPALNGARDERVEGAGVVHVIEEPHRCQRALRGVDEHVSDAEEQVGEPDDRHQRKVLRGLAARVGELIRPHHPQHAHEHSAIGGDERAGAHQAALHRREHGIPAEHHAGQQRALGGATHEQTHRQHVPEGQHPRTIADAVDEVGDRHDGESHHEQLERSRSHPKGRPALRATRATSSPTSAGAFTSARLKRMP